MTGRRVIWVTDSRASPQPHTEQASAGLGATTASASAAQSGPTRAEGPSCGPCNTRGLAAMGASMRLHLSPARGIGDPNGSPYAQPPDFPTSPLPHRVGDESGRATLITLPEQDEPRPPPTAFGSR